MTTDPAPVVKKFGPVCRWTKSQLRWLNVNYSPKTFYDFIFDLTELPDKLCQRIIPLNGVQSNSIGVKTISDGIEKLNLKAIEDQSLDLDSLNAVMGNFVTANEELVKILQRRKNKPLESQTPPNQATTPSNPRFSGESTDSTDSWSSTDSKPEHFTHLFAYQFINASLLAMKKEFGSIPWLKESFKKLINRLTLSFLMN
jgi:hypothetical protein